MYSFFITSSSFELIILYNAGEYEIIAEVYSWFFLGPVSEIWVLGFHSFIENKIWAGISNFRLPKLYEVQLLTKDMCLLQYLDNDGMKGTSIMNDIRRRLDERAPEKEEEDYFNEDRYISSFTFIVGDFI